jgi:ATP-dependent protease ClpP protease subunit
MDIDITNSDPKIESILLTICSGGGSLMAGFSLFEHIQNSIKPVNILVNSWCGSAALMILQSGKNRLATKMSRFLAHSSSHTIEREMPIEELSEYLKMNEVSHRLLLI